MKISTSWGLSLVIWSFLAGFFPLEAQFQYSVQSSAEEVGRKVAEDLIHLVRQNPRALLVLPTGATPLPLYRELQKRFAESHALDLSKIQIFFWDEYAGLSETHPLRYSYYRDEIFLKPFQSRDPLRAPQIENVQIPFDPRRTSNRGATMEEREAEARVYEVLFQEARSRSLNGRVDVFVLGAGGAYPVRKSDGSLSDELKGGHIGFNEPADEWRDLRTNVAELSEKTRKDTQFRFQSLSHLMAAGELPEGLQTSVPKFAVTLGLQNLREDANAAANASLVITLMTGESKAPVAKQVIDGEITPQFPVSLIKQFPRSRLYLDEEAAFLLKERTESLRNLSRDFTRTRFEDEFRFLEGENERRRVLVVSPHPDDDVISMGVAIKRLIELGHEVHVITMTSGQNAVRVPENFSGNENDFLKYAEALRRAESRYALQRLGLPLSHAHYLDLDFYYRRGVPGVEPLTANDFQKVRAHVVKLNPTDIFVAAENDPHGAHGLSREIVERSVQDLVDKGLMPKPQFWGYRGAYAEWLFNQDGLMVLPFPQKEMETKIAAILEHKSQVNPLFPSADAREFWQRAEDRNRRAGGRWHYITKTPTACAELFKRL